MEIFKPFEGWPDEGWPLNKYKQPAYCDSIKIAEGKFGGLHERFCDEALACYETMKDRLEAMYPGWKADGCDLMGMSLIKEIPGDPRADDDIVCVQYECGMVGLKFALRCHDTGKVIVDDNDDGSLATEFRIMAIEDCLMNNLKSELSFLWDNEDYVTATTPRGEEIKYAVRIDSYGNPTIIEVDTQIEYPVKLVI